MRKLNRTNPDFYSVLGPVFGSRLIERVTKDKFYDDEDKDWYVGEGTGDNLEYVISIKDHDIKNLYIQNENAAGSALSLLLDEVSGGILPDKYAEVLGEAGFTISPYSENFVSIAGYFTKPIKEKKKKSKKQTI